MTNKITPSKEMGVSEDAIVSYLASDEMKVSNKMTISSTKSDFQQNERLKLNDER